ncbi:cellulase family glycosylhydrolase [Robiginitalea myxolifaciens]|uniref:cellulase family glycosylhydrolase n=1 Tax=Robiginitalea myxolifaciens TaxID=400055 RepID=UPI001FE7A2EB|nr:cellulase family glycosylhydrolase [Robiginitalea myxolifaciens]
MLTSFLLVNGAIIYGIAAGWSFLNTGADRSTMLHLSGTLEESYFPEVNWDLDQQEGRPMELQTLGELEQDYRNAWYVRSLGLLNNDRFGLDDYFTTDAREKLFQQLDLNIAAQITVKSTTLQHNPQLDFYSLDGKLVVLTDHNVQGYRQIFRDGSSIHEGRTQESFRVILLLEDGFWRIRQLVKIPHESHPDPTPSREFSLESNKGINYYPKGQPWGLFGEDFDPIRIETDFRTLAEAGFNSVRIFVPYEDFGNAQVPEVALGQLREVLELAQNQQLQVLVTLFDFYGNYDILDWTRTYRHAQTVVNALKDHPALLGWDLKNEPDLDFESRGKDNVLNWLRLLSENMRTWDPNHPLTIGWSSPEAAIHLKEEVDFISFHYYGEPEDLEARYRDLRKAAGNKPLVLEEFGKSSYSGFWNVFSGSEEKQAAYLEELQSFIKEEELSSYLWTLHDFDQVPNRVVGRLPWRKAYQRHFGILDTEGNPKAAFEIVTEK